jgi:hypothetical protein
MNQIKRVGNAPDELKGRKTQDRPPDRMGTGEKQKSRAANREQAIDVGPGIGLADESKTGRDE